MAGIKRDLSEITNTAGEKIIQEKDQPAIAIKLSPESLVEKFVRFQEEKFKNGSQKLLDKFIRHSKYLVNNGQDFNEALKSEEFHNLIEFYKAKFWWKTGKYTVSFSIESYSRFIFKNDKYSFQIQNYDVEAMNKNIELVKQFIEIFNKGNEYYKITDISLDKLKQDNLPEDILKSVSWFKDKEYNNIEEFTNALETTFSKENGEIKLLPKYLPSILKYTYGENLKKINSKFYWENIYLNKIN